MKYILKKICRDSGCQTSPDINSLSQCHERTALSSLPVRPAGRLTPASTERARMQALRSSLLQEPSNMDLLNLLDLLRD